MVLQQTLYLTEYHLFLSQLRVILFFFIFRTVTARTINFFEIIFALQKVENYMQLTKK